MGLRMDGGEMVSEPDHPLQYLYFRNKSGYSYFLVCTFLFVLDADKRRVRCFKYDELITFLKKYYIHLYDELVREFF
jgi:hypothetical protein